MSISFPTETASAQARGGPINMMISLSRLIYRGLSTRGCNAATNGKVLAEFDDGLLDDLGASREEAHRAAAKPFGRS